MEQKRLEKQCFVCRRTLPVLEAFYAAPRMVDGHSGKCKSCTKAEARLNYRRNRDRYVTYEVERNKLPDRKAKRQRAQQAMRARSPEKYKARTAVGNAIRDGKLKRQPCRACGKPGQAHHHDYSKPLDVDWLCRLHHDMTHDTF